jgi:hypothetical protein
MQVEGHRKLQGNKEGKMDWNLLLMIAVIAVMLMLGMSSRGIGGG